MRLEARELSFQYRKPNAYAMSARRRDQSRRIVDNFSITLDSSERIGLTAPSGYGKTTCLKILAGYEKPDQGDVLLDGKPLSHYKGACPVQLIWQHPEQAVNPKLKMKKILEEGGGIEARIVEGLGIEMDWLNRYPSELSGGELQRFCIARALGKKTRFLLADEITAMLDLITQSQIWNFLLKETKRREIGLLVVSHSEALLNQICTRRVDMEQRESGNFI